MPTIAVQAPRRCAPLFPESPFTPGRNVRRPGREPPEQTRPPHARARGPHRCEPPAPSKSACNPSLSSASTAALLEAAAAAGATAGAAAGAATGAASATWRAGVARASHAVQPRWGGGDCARSESPSSNAGGLNIQYATSNMQRLTSCCEKVWKRCRRWCRSPG